MPDQQIQIRSRDYQITSRTRPRGLWGQVWAVVLQPGQFFDNLPRLADTRSWLWAAVLVLALTAISAVRQESLSNLPQDGFPSIDFGGAPPGTDLGGGDLGISPSSGGPIGVAPVGVSGDVGAPPNAGAPTSGAADVNATWTTALLTGAGIIVGWFILTVLLSEVSLFNGRAPVLGHNLQIAIWTSIPLALLAVLQLIYYAAGGTVGQSGLSGLLAEWEAYQGMSGLARSLLLSFTSRLTLFWIWSLILIYIAARKALKGKWYAALLVVAAWVAVLVVVPVVTGSVKAPDAVSESGLPELINDPSFGGEGAIPESMIDPFAPPSEGGVTEIMPESEAGEFAIETTAEAQSEDEAPSRPTSIPPEGENTEPSAVEGQSQNIAPPPVEAESRNAEPTAIPSDKGL